MDITSKTIESYNLCAATFVQEYMDLGLFKPFIQEFSDLLKKRSNILDLGCGPGNVVNFLINQNKGYKILGVDLSTEMLKLAKKYVPSSKFILADLRNLVLTQTFDAVIASFCIIHLTDKQATDLLRKTFDLINEGGYLYLCFMHGGIPGFEKASFSEKEMFFNYFEPEQMIEVLQNIGYRVISKNHHDYLKISNQVIQDIIIIARKFIN